MIVKMKKVTLLCLAEYKEQTLRALRDLGLLHLEHIKDPSGADLEKGISLLERTDTAAGILHHYMEKHEVEHSDTPVDQRETVEKAHELHEKLQNLTTKHDGLLIEAQNLESYGDIDPKLIEAMKDRGITIKFFKESDKKKLELPNNAVYRKLHDSGSAKIFVLISDQEFEYAGEEIPAPELKLSDVKREVSELAEQMKEVEKELTELAASHKAVEKYVLTMNDNLKYIEARDGMGISDKIAYLKGYCSHDMVDKLQEGAAKNGWGLIIEDPSEEDDAPTLIRNPKWVKPIKAVFDMIGVVPGYKEVDISAAFLVFFSIFVAMLVGDAGYGILFLLSTIWGSNKFTKAPRYLFNLLFIMSISTIVWGAITGNYFGIAPTALPGIMQGVQVKWLASDENIMKLCFIIGAIHLTIAHLWNAIRIMNSTKALAEIGWLCLTWCMFFAACSMILAYPFPTVAKVLLAVGLILVALFMVQIKELKKEWPSFVMLPLDVIGNFVDVVSYVRLFAVGSASLAVAEAFNDMALAKGFSSPVAGLLAAFIIFGGHALNIILALMGILVHGVRLNTLEFSGHIGMQWTGIKFTPFEMKANKEEV